MHASSTHRPPLCGNGAYAPVWDPQRALPPYSCLVTSARDHNLTRGFQTQRRAVMWLEWLPRRVRVPAPPSSGPGGWAVRGWLRKTPSAPGRRCADARASRANLDGTPLRCPIPDVGADGRYLPLPLGDLPSPQKTSPSFWMPHAGVTGT